VNVYELTNDIANIGVDAARPGRNSIALTEAEDNTINHVRDLALDMFERFEVPANHFEIREDAFGNLFITYFGTQRAPAVMSGSHVDSVRDGGNYDGPVGVASALKFLERMLASGQRSAHDYTVVAWRSEESSPTTGVACLGSRIATGTITRGDLEKMRYVDAAGNVTTLRDHFSNRYGALRWQQVLELAVSPQLGSDTVHAYEEVHIEQSAATQMLNADLAIVTDGIGGSRRETISIAPHQLSGYSITASEQEPYTKFTLKFFGRADHSGGAPHNGTDVRSSAPKLTFRRDALVAAHEAVSHLVAPFYSKDFPFHLLGSYCPQKTGFTTVPPEQIVELLVPATETRDAERMLQLQGWTVGAQRSVELLIDKETLTSGTHTALDAQQAWSLMQIPSQVEACAWSTIVAPQLHAYSMGGTLNSQPIQSSVGKVRATVTDFELLPNQGCHFNIDQRNVDAELAARLCYGITQVLEEKLTAAGVERASVHQVLSDSRHAPIDVVSVRTKQAIAALLGFTPAYMPSMPGHDAASMSKRGIPTSMTFVRHDGISHNPEEAVEPQHLENAVQVSHAYLATLLDLKPVQ
jgi:acetylornithine deacetylase/succinyl-diaminopimelate desuccinylase-like protein